MTLRHHKVMALDFQTTGMRPPRAQILEMAWAVGPAVQSPTIESHILALEEGQTLPPKISELTGIQAKDCASGKNIKDVYLRLIEVARTQLTEPRIAIVHYAQFERAFLKDLEQRFGSHLEPAWQVVCTTQLTSRLFPELPSRNIRAVAGFFGHNAPDFKRAGQHALATWQIWCALMEELERRGISDWQGLSDLQSSEHPKKLRKTYSYRMPREIRLQLPDQPGVYRFLSKTGKILYVGKATSLKSRVNSYFRGVSGRDPRKMEMLAQAWDVHTTICATPLEAAVLENDEIKRLDPPYNIALKAGQRTLIFTNRHLNAVAAAPSAEFPIGPLRGGHSWFDSLVLLFEGLTDPSAPLAPVFHVPLPEEDLRAGWREFSQRHSLAMVQSRRQLLAQALRLHRRLGDVREPPATVEGMDPIEVEEDTETTPTPAEIADKFERLFQRTGREWAQMKLRTRTLNADLCLNLATGPRRLHIRNGQLTHNPQLPAPKPHPWHGLNLIDYDRVGILLSELAKVDFTLVKVTDSVLASNINLTSPRSI